MSSGTVGFGRFFQALSKPAATPLQKSYYSSGTYWEVTEKAGEVKFS